MKDIQGYEGMYAVTSCGKVYSYRNKKFLKPQRVGGYLQVRLYKDGEQKNYYIHRLVAEAYLPNPEGFSQVNHKDENKENNALPNLEWCTNEYNNNYGSHSKPVFCIELNRTFTGARAAARELGLIQPSITKCCNGKLKTTGGFHFRYQR